MAQPMIQHVYERARAARGVDRVLVATDDARIRAAVAAFGGDVVMTSPAHRTGTDRIAEVAAGARRRHRRQRAGRPAAARPGDGRAAVAPLRADAGAADGDDQDADPRRGEERDNPNVVKVVTDRDGYALYFSRSPLPYWRDGGAPAARSGYKHIGLYAYRRDFLLTLRAARADAARARRAARAAAGARMGLSHQGGGDAARAGDRGRYAARIWNAARAAGAQR